MAVFTSYRGLPALSVALAVFFLSACASPEPTRSEGVARVGSGESAVAPGTLVLSVEPGPRWTHRMMLFAAVPPSYAGWIETADGEYVGTLLVSGKAGKGGWLGAPAEGRPESVPVWYHAAAALSSLDAISSASSAAGAAVAVPGGSLKTGREYVARFEINHSYDYNGRWKKADTGVNGQPSLVYEACFVFGNPETLTLKPVGHGSPDGSSGEVVPSLEGFTTALEIVEKITLEVH